jgi:hypothetical protein
MSITSPATQQDLASLAASVERMATLAQQQQQQQQQQQLEHAAAAAAAAVGTC